MKKIPILKITNLCVDFPTENHNLRAVDSINYTLNSGETLGIVGESGSGKTLSALSILQLISLPGIISQGNICFKYNDHWIDLLTLTHNQLKTIRGKKISMIFQEPMTSLNPVYTCGKQICETIMLHQNVSKKEAKQKTIQLLKEVLLPRANEIYNSYPHELSGGQKQRVMIAMALSCNPDILIADEPSTALDVTIQKSILELLKSLQKKYLMSIIFITHDLNVIAEVADRVIVMYRGKIVEENDIKSIFRNPQNPYTRGLIACRPSLNQNRSRLLTINDFMNLKPESSVQELINTLVIKNQRSIKRKITEEQPILSIKDLSTFFPVKKQLFEKKRKWIRAVDGVCFDVYFSETFGIIGESGCGKTTLGRSILRLIEPQSGKIYYKNKNIITYSKSQLQFLSNEFQIIFQDPYSSLNPRKIIGHAITEPMTVHKLYDNKKIRYEKTIELLEKVQLTASHYNRYPHELSGGERQRVCIARALSLNPKFIICDESVSALDVSVQAHILNLLNELKKEFLLTYIFISHDLSVVKHMSDRIAVMKEGKIVEIGTAEKVYHDPDSEYTKKLIDAVPRGFI